MCSAARCREGRNPALEICVPSGTTRPAMPHIRILAVQGMGSLLVSLLVRGEGMQVPLPFLSDFVRNGDGGGVSHEGRGDYG